MSRNGYGRFGEDRYKVIAKHGYECVDYNGAGEYDLADTSSKTYTLPENEALAAAGYEKELAKASGITVFQAHGPWCAPLVHETEEARSGLLEKMFRAVHVSSALGCRRLVVHPVLANGFDDKGTDKQKETFRINVEFMKKLSAHAKEYGINICYENMPFQKFSISTPKEIMEVVRAVDMDNFKVCLDTGHACALNIALCDAVREIGSDLFALHVHDTFPKDDRHLWPYFGSIEWDGFYKALQDAGFEGVLSLETIPSHKLNDKLFDEAGYLLNKIASQIIKP